MATRRTRPIRSNQPETAALAPARVAWHGLVPAAVEAAFRRGAAFDDVQNLVGTSATSIGLDVSLRRPSFAVLDVPDDRHPKLRHHGAVGN